MVNNNRKKKWTGVVPLDFLQGINYHFGLKEIITKYSRNNATGPGYGAACTKAQILQEPRNAVLIRYLRTVTLLVFCAKKPTSPQKHGLFPSIWLDKGRSTEEKPTSCNKTPTPWRRWIPPTRQPPTCHQTLETYTYFCEVQDVPCSVASQHFVILPCSLAITSDLDDLYPYIIPIFK